MRNLLGETELDGGEMEGKELVEELATTASFDQLVVAARDLGVIRYQTGATRVTWGFTQEFKRYLNRWEINLSKEMVGCLEKLELASAITHIQAAKIAMVWQFCYEQDNLNPSAKEVINAGRFLGEISTNDMGILLD